MVAYDIHARYNRVVICYCLFALIVDAVGSLAGVDHLQVARQGSLGDFKTSCLKNLGQFKLGFHWH